jgi:hypothetical protein
MPRLPVRASKTVGVTSICVKWKNIKERSIPEGRRKQVSERRKKATSAERKGSTYVFDSASLASIDDLNLDGLAFVGEGSGEGLV